MDGDRSSAAPLVVFTSRPNSHPFQERHIYCQDPVKIGRSVARAHPLPTNAIFDCKVLSRNHALLWFEDDKFYLQDTKSSNGTFVNNQRLSKGSEESDPHQIYSGDIIQFGVDVMENSKRVTHGCIMASITLYLADGTEARPRFSGSTQTSSLAMTAVHSQEMYQLSQYLQEALHREQVLQEKMSHLQNLLHTTNESCESGWHALINEDRLLSKLEVLQNQLSVFSKAQTESGLQQQIVAMEEERIEYENSSKESLRKVIEEKIAAIQDLSDVERSLANAENECKHLKAVHEEGQSQFSELTEKYEKKVLEHLELSNQLQEAEQRRDDDLVRYEDARSHLQAKLEESLADKDTLMAKVSFLQQSHSPIISKSDELRSSGEEDKVRLNGDMSDEEREEEPVTLTPVALIESLTHQLEESNSKVESFQNKLNEVNGQMQQREEDVAMLNQSVEQAQLEIVSYVTKVASLEDRLKTLTSPSMSSVEQTTERLQEEIMRITASHEEAVNKLKAELLASRMEPSGDASDRVQSLEDELQLAQRNTEELNLNIQNMQEELREERVVREQHQVDVCRLKDELEETKREVESQSSATAEFKEKAKVLEERLQEMVVLHEQQAKQSEQDCSQLREEVSNNKKECESLREECASLRRRVQSIEEELQSTKSQNAELAGEIQQLQKSYAELKERKESLETSESTMKDNLTDVQKESNILKAQLEKEKADREELLSKYDQSVEELKATREQVETTQALHSDAQQRLDAVNKQLLAVSEDYRQLSEKSKSGILCSTLPLMVLVLAVALALYPLFSRVTAS
ncbi:sarcolemmal membrane-associated protein-like isoform X2 [Watersipora subatra]|uniref:sarcolemmal membrane-associated protein-like isoform X2 n=1 Tax=Watersipora subatra TaxID=2589382 RepID=UPI00355AFECF